MAENGPLRSVVGLCASVLVVLCFFRAILWSDHVPLYGDLVFFVIPMKHFLSERIAAGELPLWNPWIYMGTPFLAGLQTGVFYPPTLLLALPFPYGFDWFLIFHYLLALAGCWALFRDRSASAPACAVGGLTFVLGGYLVSMISETNHLQAAAWVPWVLLSWMRYRRSLDRLDFTAFVFVSSVQLLAGAPETLAMTIAIAVAWMVRTSRSAGDGLRSAAALGGAIALVAMVTAFQTLPTAEYLSESDRGTGLSFAEVASWSLEPISLLQLVLPRIPPIGVENGLAVGFESYTPWIQSLYLGIAPLCLLVAGIAVGRDRVFWTIVGGFGLVFALGSHTPLLRVSFDVAPRALGLFRYPEKAWLCVHLSAAMLAAEGMEAFARNSPRGPRIVMSAAAALASLAALLIVAKTAEPSALRDWVAAARGVDGSSPIVEALFEQVGDLSWRLAAIAVVVSAIAWLHVRRAVAGSLCAILLVVATAVDLYGAHRALLTTASWSTLETMPLLVDRASANERHERIFHYQISSSAFPGMPSAPVRGLAELDRVMPASDDARALWLDTWRISFADIGMVHGVANISGGDGIGRRSNAVLMEALSSVSRDDAIRLLRTYSVAWLIGTSPLESNQLEAVSPVPPSRYYVYRVRDPIPEVRLVSRLETAVSDETALRRLAAADFEVASRAVVDRLPRGWDTAARRGDPGIVRLVSYLPEDVTIEVDAKAPSLLLLNDSDFPGWEAEIDGQRTDIVRANVFSRGVAVGLGHHRVQFRYRLRSLRIGAALSAFGVLALAGCFAGGLRR
jgi:hypothetical protein